MRLPDGAAHWFGSLKRAYCSVSDEAIATLAVPSNAAAAQYIRTRCFAVSQLIFSSPPAWVGSAFASTRKAAGEQSSAWVLCLRGHGFAKNFFWKPKFRPSAHATGAGPLQHAGSVCDAPLLSAALVPS